MQKWDEVGRDGGVGRQRVECGTGHPYTRTPKKLGYHKTEHRKSRRNAAHPCQPSPSSHRMSWFWVQDTAGGASCQSGGQPLGREANMTLSLCS